MLAIFLVTFRETLEASIIVGLVFSLLQVFWISNFRKRYIGFWIFVWILGSVIFAIMFQYLFGGFEWTSEKIYEGILMILGCVFITRFIIWTHSHFNNIWSNIKKVSEQFKSSNQLWFLSVLVALSVLREWVETVIFLNALSFSSEKIEIIFAALWIVWALIISWFLYASLKKIKLQKLLVITNIFFIFIAGWLLAHGIIEFQEAWILPNFINPLYDISSILSEKQGLWSILKAAVHYDSNPSLLSFLAYIIYMWIVFSLFLKNKKEM
jgi:high-affinity iron transporter